MGDGVVWGSVKIPGSFNGGKMNSIIISTTRWQSYRVHLFLTLLAFSISAVTRALMMLFVIEQMVQIGDFMVI